MPWMMPAAIGGAALLGDVMSQQGQQSTNAAMTSNMLENQQWQEYMSDTAMQRRVADLKAANLNPMLAVSGPGAGMGSPVMPNIQNPASAFGNLGGQAASAMQSAGTQAQIRATNAQAAYTESLTPSDDVVPVDEQGHVDWQSMLSSPHGGLLGKLNAADLMSHVNQVNATVDNLKSSTDVNRTTNDLRQVDLGVARESASAVIQKAVNDARLSGAELSIEQARAKVLGGPMGPAIQAIESVLGGGFLGKVLSAAISAATPGRGNVPVRR